MAEAPPRLCLRGITRSFGRRRALAGVDLDVRPGEVVGLIGENGAGKTTLVNVLYGLVEPDSGSIEIDGRAVAIRSPRAARALGIGVVHQHFSLALGLTVAENFALDDAGMAWLRYSPRAVEQRVRAIGLSTGLVVDPRARAGDLAVGDRQRAEILKALKREVGLLVLDEPTATLAPRESRDLLGVIGRLREAGRSVLFISHKIDEVLAVAERVVVLRGGAVVWDGGAAATSAAELAVRMIGRPPAPRAARPAPPATPLLSVRGLRVPGARGGRPAVDGVDLEVRSGEIVAIAGVDGNGQDELAEALAGLRPIDGGEILLAGRMVRGHDPAGVRALGLRYIPSDRGAVGLAGPLSLADHLLLGHRERRELRRGPGFAAGPAREFVAERLATFGVRPADPGLPAAALSGGNQQRLILARELAFEPRVVVAHNPTRGLDVGASEYALDCLVAARARGAAVILLTTEIDEAATLADRLFVMNRGRLAEALSRDATTLGQLLGGAGA